MHKSYASKEDIIDKVKIVDIADEFGIELQDISSGNFDYCCRCPSKKHKGGAEKTGSLYIDSERNNFYCFGCNTGNNSIDFYMLCKDITFIEAFNELKHTVEPGAKKTSQSVRAKDNFYTLLQISNLFRKTMLENKHDIKWINNLMKKSDKYLLDIDQRDEDKAEAIFQKIKNIIDKRYSK